MRYINLEKLKALLSESRETYKQYRHEFYEGAVFAIDEIEEDIIDTFQQEQPDDISLIKDWFEHIAQIADDRKTLTGEVMEDSHALDEIKSIAKNSVYYIEHHYQTSN